MLLTESNKKDSLVFRKSFKIFLTCYIYEEFTDLKSFCGVNNTSEVASGGLEKLYQNRKHIF